MRGFEGVFFFFFEEKEVSDSRSLEFSS